MRPNKRVYRHRVIKRHQLYSESFITYLTSERNFAGHLDNALEDSELVANVCQNPVTLNSQALTVHNPEDSYKRSVISGNTSDPSYDDQYIKYTLKDMTFYSYYPEIDIVEIDEIVEQYTYTNSRERFGGM